jgi:hypothetical protein
MFDLYQAHLISASQVASDKNRKLLPVVFLCNK